MSTEETKLTALWKRFEAASQRRPLKKNCARKVQELRSIWDDLRGLQIYIGSGHYGEVESLRLRILREVAPLDSNLFGELQKELRDKQISAAAEVRLLLIKITTLPSRFIDRIDRHARRVTK
jgi:hypothetical protein